MNLLIIGANGRQGRLLTEKAILNGHTVTALSPNGMDGTDFSGTVLTKSLFDLSKADIAGTDAVLSAFGAGFDADPRINRQAVDYLIDLIGDKNTSLLILGGAGTLYTDSSHSLRVWQTPEHPDFLRDISKNLSLALDDLRASSLPDWTFLCPSLVFDYEGAETGRWQIGTNEEVIYNAAGISRISYRDFASAMIREAETREHRKMQITVCEI